MADIVIDGKFKMCISFYVKNKQKSQRSQIWLYTSINGTKVKIYTKMTIEPLLWQKKGSNGQGEMACESKSYGNVKYNECKDINKRLKEILGFCHDYASRVVNESLDDVPLEHSPESFKAFIIGKIKGDNKNGKIDALSYIKDYIERKATMLNKDTKRILCQGTVFNHQNALKRLLMFCEDKRIKLSWKTFDAKFQETMTYWLCKKNYTANTISSQFSTMKVWLNQAEKDGITVNKVFHHYPTKVYNVENIYLTESEIQALYDLDFTSKEVQDALGYAISQGGQYEETRDLFIIGCWTALRYGDLRHFMDISVITEDYITIHTHKTDKEGIIPIHPMVKAIIKKYNGVLPRMVDKTRTLAQIRKCAELAGINEPTTLCKVKGGHSIVSKGPKFQFICNHTARRSFATNMYLRGVPTISIMAITGHTNEENFMKYIKVDKMEHAKVVAKFFE